MHNTDFLFGSFEFPTEITREGDIYIARAQGYEARSAYQDIALNDLNAKLNDALERGEIIPGQ